MTKKIILLMLMIFILSFQVSCQKGPIEESLPPSNSALPVQSEEAVVESSAIMNEFIGIADDNVRLQELLLFIDEHLPKVSVKEASLMIETLENIMKNQLLMYEAIFFGENQLQSKMAAIYQRQFSINDIYESDDAEIKSLTTSILETGYKIETAEGSFFPVVDYAFYQKYNDYLTDDYREYINIMSLETDYPAAKDAGLYITYEEILKRLLSQEAFLHTYPDAVKADTIKMQYGRYVYFLLYGADNTPLFAYDSKKMNEDAKNIYTTLLSGAASSKLAEIMAPYIALIERNSYTLTEEVVSARSNVQESLLKAAGIE